MMINVTYVVLFVLLVALSSVPVEAGLTKFFKKLGNQISDAGERLVKHVNGESDCKGNCQIAKDYSECFENCMNNREGVSVEANIVTLEF